MYWCRTFIRSHKTTTRRFPFFATRLEGTLNQIRLQCPRRIMDWEVQQHLKDHLFHGVLKTHRGWIHYLYSNPETKYSQLMVAACKVESKNEEAWDKVQARSAVMSLLKKPLSWETKIARLMGAPTREGQGNSPSSTPNSPRHRGLGRGRTDRTTSSCPKPHNVWTGLGQTASACSVSAGCRTGTPGQSQGNAQGPNDGQGSISNKKDPSSLQYFRCQGWGIHGLGVCHPNQVIKPDWGTKGMWPNHPPVAANNKPPAFLPGPKPRPTILKAAQKWGQGHPCSFPYSRSYR